MSDELVMIMAGGKGQRLYPLSRDRAKPAVPFGGKYRVIDFVLSNFVNSGFYRIKILTQFKSDSLNRHVSRGWNLSGPLGHYIDLVPAQMRTGDMWYQGTADAIFQNINLIADQNPKLVLIFGGDHIYRMDMRQMVDFHKRHNADITVSTVPLSLERASQMGIVEIGPGHRILGFTEKPAVPKPIPGHPDMALVSMGNYIFNTDILLKILASNHQDGTTAHDFGRNILPQVLQQYKVLAYDFANNICPGMEEQEKGYWCDIGTIDAYWESNMDLCSVTPRLNLYNHEWPIRTTPLYYPPAKFVFADENKRRIGRATDSMVSEGCIISGGRVNRSILSPGVRVNSYAQVTDSVLMANVDIGRHCKIKKAIIDKNVSVPSRTVIGYNLERDREKYHVTESGIVVIPKKEKING